VACGFGGNALYLASSGYRVDAVDASGVALAQAQAEAKRRGLHINLVQADLTRWWVAPGRYDLISVFFYLNRALMPPLAAGLRPGGLLFQAGRNTRSLDVRPNFDPAFLFKPGELPQLARASGLEVLHQADGERSSTLIARQPQ
jgi:SAM-dependent methyltransferase